VAKQIPATTTRYGVHQRRERVRDVRALWRVIKFSLSRCNPSFPGWPRFPGRRCSPSARSSTGKLAGGAGGSNVNDAGRRAGPPRFLRQALPTSGAWFSPRRWTLRSSLRPGRHGRASQPVDPASDLGEQRSRHRHLGQLKGHVTAVAHEPRADLDQLLAQGRQRPLRDRVRQRPASAGCSRGHTRARTVAAGPCWPGRRGATAASTGARPCLPGSIAPPCRVRCRT
jgi:hypothetical protein